MKAWRRHGHGHPRAVRRTGDDARGARAFALFAHVVAEHHPTLMPCTLTGVVKLKVDSDDQYAFTRAIADHVLAATCELVGSAGKSLSR